MAVVNETTVSPEGHFTVEPDGTVTPNEVPHFNGNGIVNDIAWLHTLSFRADDAPPPDNVTSERLAAEPSRFTGSIEGDAGVL